MAHGRIALQLVKERHDDERYWEPTKPTDPSIIHEGSTVSESMVAELKREREQYEKAMKYHKTDVRVWQCVQEPPVVRLGRSYWS